MLIPEYAPKSNALKTIGALDEFEKLRASVTDRLLLMLVVAEWDSASMLLSQMLAEMPKAYSSIQFAVVDADKAPELTEQFKIDAVPAVVLLHPHKQQAEVMQAGISAEWLTDTVTKQNNFYATLF
jgi:thioredoxin-like negative regulator of GroEL